MGAVLARGIGTASVRDADVLPSVTVSDASVVVGGSATTASFVLSLNVPSAVPVSVRVATSNSTAVAGRDYTAVPSTTVTFPPGETTQSVSVPVAPQPDAGLTTSFKLALSGPSGATVGDSSGTASLVPAAGAPQVEVSDASVMPDTSSGTSMVFTIGLVAPAAAPVTVTYATADSTAKVSAGDYTATSGSVTIPAGSTSAQVPVPVAADPNGRPNRTFSFKVTKAVGGTLTDTAATATILANG
jgi:hypothetical protein